MAAYFQGTPDIMIACVGGGSNAMGFFADFLDNKEIKLIGVEAGGYGEGIGEHAARIHGGGGTLGIAQGYKSLFLQNEEGQLASTHSISAGLDYAGIGPQLAYLAEHKRVEFTRATDDECSQCSSFLHSMKALSCS